MQRIRAYHATLAILAIAEILVGATVSGIAIDRGRDIGLAEISVVAAALTDDGGARKSRSGGFAHEVLEEVHEPLSNLMILFVILRGRLPDPVQAPAGPLPAVPDRAPR